MPSEPVARILSIHSGWHPSAGRFLPGQFYPVALDRSGQSGGGVMRVAAVVVRGDTLAIAQNNMPLFIGDFFRTSPDTLATLEFLIGGRVSVGKSMMIEVVSERSVADKDDGSPRPGVQSTSLWTKWHAEALKQPLEIQTNGGTLGIKG